MTLTYSHEDAAYFLTLTTPSLQGERRIEKKLCLRELAKVYMEEFIVALCVLPYLLPCSQGFCVLPYLPVFCLTYCHAHMISVFCLTYCHAHMISMFCLIYCRAHRVSVFFLIYSCAHRVSMFCYVPYFLGFALVFPLRTLP
ncbi:hypothetical protein L3X38_027288 [Prunus dulcis]|uniref:Uncharacterized protein n=1 Tax=Prunus dulcis TaxID=3755 RepID=A0AAD4YZB2_PRUDU|nr:hypothetical protein L3X38_027288 [Prunus dulcis]